MKSENEGGFNWLLALIFLVPGIVFLMAALFQDGEPVKEELDLGTKVNLGIQESMNWAANRKLEIQKTNKLLGGLCATECEEFGAKFVSFDVTDDDPNRWCTCTTKEDMVFFYLYELPGEGTRIKWKERVPQQQ